jgi:hypothetical protein
MAFYGLEMANITTQGVQHVVSVESKGVHATALSHWGA